MVMVLHPCRGSFCESFHLNDYDPRNCSLANGNPCNLCIELDTLDADIGRAYDLFLGLAQKRRILKEKINRRHDPLIQHLPLEIIRQIFMRCVEDANPRFLEQKNARFSKAECSAPLILGAVCRTWREIALATPELWRTINIYLYPSSQTQLQGELARQWLARSGQLPLTISIYYPADLKESDLGHSSPSPLFDAVRADAHRWQRLALRIPTSSNDMFVGELTCVPRLESLQFYTWFDGTSMQTFHLAETPMLVDLWMNNTYLHIINIQWTNLTVFEMKLVSPEEIFEVLRRTGRLEKCIFPEIQTNYGAYPEALPMTPFTHLSLKYVELGPTNGTDLDLNDFRFLLDHLVLPHLDHFVYDTTHSSTVPVYNLLSLFSRSQCTIKAFKMQAPSDYITDHELIQILEHLPTLRQLSLISLEVRRLNPPKWITNKLFERFREGAELSPANFLPHLEDLEVSSDPLRAFSWDCFLTSMTSLQSHLLGSQRNTALHARVNSDVITPSPLLPTSEWHRDHLNVTLKLHREKFGDIDYIAPHVVRRLANPGWEHGVSLRILDKVNGTDVVEASLHHHGFEAGKNNMSKAAD